MKLTRIALTLWTAGAVAHAEESRADLTVYLRDRSTDRHVLLPRAKQIAAGMFAKIGISVEWKKWNHSHESSPPPIVIDMRTETPDNRMPGALGYAQLGPGSHIMVFLDRIETMRDPSDVLAHVIVHETAHVLQGISRHSDSGVMKAHWDGSDYAEMRLRPLSFTQEDVDLIYWGLSERHGVTPTLEVAR